MEFGEELLSYACSRIDSARPLVEALAARQERFRAGLAGAKQSNAPSENCTVTAWEGTVSESVTLGMSNDTMPLESDVFAAAFNQAKATVSLPTIRWTFNVSM
jgi:hypothetical protein